MVRYPRVLIVNAEPINRCNATGITMGNLFRGWPKDRIAQIYLRYYLKDSLPDATACEKSWYLEIEDLRMPECARKMITFYRRYQERSTRQSETSLMSSLSNPLLRKTLSGSIVRSVKELFFQAMEFSSFRVSEELIDWIEEFRPDVIYSILGNLLILKLVKEIADKFAMPIVPHFMDDWIITCNREGLLNNILRRSLLERTNYLIRNAPVLMVISEAMANEYKRRYNRVFLPFMNCVEIKNNKEYKHDKYNKSLKLIYAGSMHLNRWESLIDIGNALLLIREKGIECSIEIYGNFTSNDVINKIKKIPELLYMENLTNEEVIKMLQKADGVIHVESFDSKVMDYTRFSLSTKLPEYLVSGRPIFAYGPGELASIKYIADNGCGMVVDKKNQRQLVSKLQEFILDERQRNEFGQQARRLAEERHDARVNRELFRAAFESIFD
jgi:glycosyltransferase involved in cell wall biosynthesis